MFRWYITFEDGYNTCVYARDAVHAACAAVKEHNQDALERDYRR